MYICKECNTKYKVKPDYCDCGNDTFEYIEDKPKQKVMTLEEKSELVSRIFFAICLIMAILVWFIPVGKNISGSENSSQNVKNVQPAGTIPNIDKIWNDTPAYTSKPTQTTQPQQVYQTTEPIVLTPTGSVPEQKKNLTKSQNENKNVQPKVVSPKEPAKSSKPVASNNKKVVASPVVSPEQKVQPKKVEPKKQTYNPKSPAMIEYKTKLRATLFSKFAVGSIKGSGNCAVSFSVDQNGKLINRKFTKESDNKSLNDAVYYMLMSVPYFSVPPAEYNGSPISMTFYINNGNYEISIY